MLLFLLSQVFFDKQIGHIYCGAAEKGVPARVLPPADIKARQPCSETGSKIRSLGRTGYVGGVLDRQECAILHAPRGRSRHSQMRTAVRLFALARNCALCACCGITPSDAAHSSWQATSERASRGATILNATIGDGFHTSTTYTTSI